MPVPFLTYLTVFKSRLGVSNILLALTGFAHQPEQALLRKVRRVLEERVELDVHDLANAGVFAYLSDKRVVGPQLRKSGRYTGYALLHGSNGWEAQRKGGAITSLPVFRTDIWMSDAAVPSTIAVPTPENASETLEFGFQLRLLSPSKNTWTAGGQLIAALRAISANDSPQEDNPFLLTLESVGLLRQLVAADGIVLRELLRWLDTAGGQVSRDQVASAFAKIVDRAYEGTQELGVPPPSLREAREFRDLIRKTATSISGSSGPGVLEHRVSPRLEWLTDLGYLSKEGLQKNAFQYHVTPAVGDLLGDLDTWFGENRWSDDVAISQWRANPSWAQHRAAHAHLSPERALVAAYRSMQRRIGPAPIAEVAFIASLLRADHAPYKVVVDQLVELAQATDGVSLSGGRYRRSPENIHMSDAALARID